ncbi:rim15, signal transduction response regulator [Coemansia sp. RSA 1933]|nr:rim15, signal transduction response regulator [Coemansia sp. RSA 1933]
MAASNIPTNKEAPPTTRSGRSSEAREHTHIADSSEYNNSNNNGSNVSTSSQHELSVLSETNLRGTPKAQQRAGSSGLGLRPPSIHTPENASTYSAKSISGSISGDSKPPSQKSSGIGFVRRLRKLSSAALHGKVNKLFSRSVNPSQDSLLLGVPSSPSACSPPKDVPHSPTAAPWATAPSVETPKGGRGSVLLRAHGSPSPTRVPGTASSPSSDWRIINSSDLPPLPPKPISSRRSRALTELAPLAIRDRLEQPNMDIIDTSDGSESQRSARTRAKATNSPLITSPLSRKSFHALNTVSSCDSMATDDAKDGARAGAGSGSTKKSMQHSNSLLVTGATQRQALGKSSLSPKLIRSSSHNHGVDSSYMYSRKQVGPSGDATIEQPSPVFRRSSSHQYNEGYSTFSAAQVPTTPSPPEKKPGRLQPPAASDARTPTMQRRRTALASFAWPRKADSGVQGEYSMVSSLSPPPMPMSASSSSLYRTGSTSRKPHEGSTDSPSSLLSSLHLRPRISPGLFRQRSTGASTHSSASVADDSIRSWTSAASNADRDSECDDDINPHSRQDSPALMTARSSKDGIRGGRSPIPLISESLSMVPSLFDQQLMDWRLSQDGSATLYSHSPASSTVQDLANSSSQTSDPLSVLRHSGDGAEHSSTSVTSSAPNIPTAPMNIHHHSSAQNIVRPRGGSQPAHLARTATTNAIRLKEKSAVSQVVDDAVKLSQHNSRPYGTAGSAPEQFSIDHIIERSKAQFRVRASSASHQPFASDEIITSGSSNGGDQTPSRAIDGSSFQTPQNNPLSRNNSTSSAMVLSRPPSSMSAYTMSPVSSNLGDDASPQVLHSWQLHPAIARSSPDRFADGIAASNTGAYPPSSTSSPTAHYHMHSSSVSGHHHHHSSQGSQQLRLNTSSVQRSASGHSMSSGISELLEPSSVSLARKDALWQVLVVSKSRADTEIDKMMRRWKEMENGSILCTQDTESKQSVGDEEAIILKVKRGHHRSSSDIKRADGDKNEFRRRVIDLTNLIRGSSVSDLSNETITRGITEQLYGLLTEQRTRFPADANIGTLILDVLYQFSAVSQTVSQLSMPTSMFPGARSGISGEASPATSQYPSPQLAPESSLGRGSVSMLPPLTSALSSQYDQIGSRYPSSRVSTVRDLTENTFGGSAMSELATISQSGGYPRSQQEPISVSTSNVSSASFTDYRNLRSSSEGPHISAPQYPRQQSTGTIGGSSADSYTPGIAPGGRTRQAESASYMSSPRLLPGTAQSSTASLLSLLVPAHSSAAGSVGRSGAAGSTTPGSLQPGMGTYQRQRFYFPQPSTTPQSSRMSMDIADSENEMSARPSLDEPNDRPILSRHASKLSISSDLGGESSSLLHKRSARVSLQPNQLFHHFVNRSQKLIGKPKQPPSVGSSQGDNLGLSSNDETPASSAMMRLARPLTMYNYGGGHSSYRRVSESALRQEKLARLLADEMDINDSSPASPADESSQLSPYDTDPESRARAAAQQAASTALLPIPEAQRNSEIDYREPLRKNGSLAGSVPTTYTSLPLVPEVAGKEDEDLHKDFAESPKAMSQKSVSPKAESSRRSLAHLSLERDSQQHSEGSLGLESTDHGAVAMETKLAPSDIPDDEFVVCRICERSFFRSELNAHSDVCILEQTRALKLDEVNNRIKRLRDPLAKRLSDLRKARQWDKGAIRASERVVRIAERAVAWPEGDSQHDLIVAKAKFTKYIEKLEDITGIASSGSALNGSNSDKGLGAVGPGPISPSSNALPKADIETMWLARQLLVRIAEKRTIIEEFDKEFSRLERQEALMREAEVSDTLPENNAQFIGLPTWSQLARSDQQESSVASERTSMDLAQSQSGSGTATPDVNPPSILGIGRGRHDTMTRKKSKGSSSHPSRRSLSRNARSGHDFVDSDSHGSSAGSNSGPRKLVSLFAALFRNGSSGFGRNKDMASHSGTVLRRKNAPSPLTTGTLPTMSKSNSILRRISQTPGSGQPTTPTSAQSNASNSSSNNNFNQSRDHSAGPTTPLAISTASAAATSSGGNGGSSADAPLSSPVTRQRNNSQISTGARATPESMVSKAQRMPSIDDFDFVKPISRGAFGRVYLARKKATKDLYAIKVMRKKDMINKNMVTQALAERRALSLLSTEWVVQLYYAFHSSKHLFLVMEYLLGGDLAGLLRVWGVMDEDAAKFYFAEIACAIDYLHRNSIVHRDIKPDNVIVASDGHIKLTDFGLSQVAVRGNAENKALLDGTDGNPSMDSPTSDTTPIPTETDVVSRLPEKSDEYWNDAFTLKGNHTQTPISATNNPHAGKAVPASKRGHARKSSQQFLGTPDYLAPELLLGAGNGLAVDWWALGVCLFEFLCGYPPFTDESPEAIFRNILNHALDWPEEEGFVTEEAVELINSLLRPDPAERAHWKDIQSAKLFDGWDMKSIGQMEPPFIPQPDDEVDTSYFDTCQHKEVQRLSNATFLQVDVPRKQQQPQPPLPMIPKQHLQKLPQSPAKESAPVDIGVSQESSKESPHGSRRGSQKGSRRGSRRDRPLSGSASVIGSTNIARSDVGQLKRLFAELTVESESSRGSGSGSGSADSNEKEPIPEEPSSNDEPDNASQVRQSTFASSETSSDGYSFKDDLDADPTQTSVHDVHNESSSSSLSGRKNVAASGKDDEMSSTRSLNSPELEILSTCRDAGVPKPIAISRNPTGRTSGAMLPPLPMTHAKRVASRSPSQFSDGAVDVVGGGGMSSKSHSRCASASMLYIGGKPESSVSKSRRPSHGAADYMYDSDIGLPLARSISADERYRHNTPDGPSSLLSHMVSETESPANDSLGEEDSDGADNEVEDADAERAFDDFAYKNLALLSNVNKGVSSSGPITPAADKTTTPAAPSTPLSSTAPSGVRLSAQVPASPSARESLINAYDPK